MPIQEGKYVTPAWQNGGPPAIDAAELTAIGNSIVQNQTNIESLQTDNTQNQSNIEQLQEWKTSAEPLLSGALQKSGGTMTGNLILNANPTQNMQAATKQYVDNTFGWTLLQNDSISLNGTSDSATFSTPSVLLDKSATYSEVKILFAVSISLQDSVNATYVNVAFGDGVNRLLAARYIEGTAPSFNFSNNPLIYYATKSMYLNASYAKNVIVYNINLTHPDESYGDSNFYLWFGPTYKVKTIGATVNGNIYFYGR